MAWQVLYVNTWSFCPLPGFGKTCAASTSQFWRYLRNNYNDTMNYDTAISAVPSQILAKMLVIRF
jgi:hypothetical protein